VSRGYITCAVSAACDGPLHRRTYGGLATAEADTGLAPLDPEHHRGGAGGVSRPRGPEGAISTDFPVTPAHAALDVVAVLLVLAVAGLLVAAVRLIRTRLGEHREEDRELPPLVYPARLVNDQRSRTTAARAAVSASGEHVLFNSSAQAAPPVRIVREVASSEDGVASTHEAAAANGRGQAVGDADLKAADAADSDVTLQLLPGRLEPVDSGMDQEIRFVRVPGENRFTFGRNPGPSHSHIQLRAVTASRMHASMVFEGGRWRLGNMSLTNPVVVNGSPLAGDGVHELEDGDRIEFGELTFVFRER
jgi:hypothetical protein